MPLGWKATLVFVLMLVVGGLTLLARRRNFDRVRRHYTSRRTRVPTTAPPKPPAEVSRDRGSSDPAAG